MATDLHAIETKFNRCLRYIEKHLPEAEKCLDESVLEKPSSKELEALLEKMHFLTDTIEPRIVGLQEHAAEHESKVADLGTDSTDQMSDKTEEQFDQISEIQDTVKKLKARLERIKRMQDRAQMLSTGLGSHESLASTQYDAADRLQRLRNDEVVSNRCPGRTDLAPEKRGETDQENSTGMTNAIDRQNENVNENGGSRHSQVCLHSLTNSQIYRGTANGAENQPNATSPAPTSRNPATGAERQSTATNPNAQSRNPASTAEGQTDAENIVQLLYNHLQQESRQGGQSSNNESHLRLPKYNLPEFTGEPELWNEFWDKFDKAINQRSTLADVEKLQYLQGCCKADAKKLVGGLPLSNHNYRVACTLLQERFGNPNIAIDKIYARLVEMNSVPPRNTEKLREFYFELENSLRRLEALGADAQSNHMVGVVLRKLPRYLVAQLERNKGPKQQWSMQLLRELLSVELEIEEATYRQSEHKRTEKQDHGKQKAEKTTTGSFKADERPGGRYKKQENQTDRTPTCFYCKGKHWSDECTKVKTATERRAVVKSSKCCFICLKSNHTARDCKSEKPCFHCKKIKMHHGSICPMKFGSWRDPDSARAGDEGIEDLTDQDETAGLASDEHAVMKTATCEAINPKTGQSDNVRAFFDTGTSRTWITEKCARKLKLKVGPKKRLLVNRFADDGAPKGIEMREALLVLRNRKGKTWKITVAVTANAMGSITMTDKSEIARHIPKHLQLADRLRYPQTKAEIDIMVGNDYYDDLVYSERMQISSGLRLINSAFGWIVSGRMKNSTEQSEYGDMAFFISERRRADPEISVQIEENKEIRQNLEDLWSLEAIGIRDEPNDITDDATIENFNQTVKFDDGRYHVTWPWKNNAELLPKNDDLALRRLKCLLNRMQKEKVDGFLKEYDEIMRDQLAKGVIEEVPSEQIETKNRVHYIPHHGVVKPHNLTTKLRVVYDASAKRSPDLPSLNECLHRGQVFLENLVALLIRLRLYKIAVLADIEKAFLQIGLQDSERDVTRFYWVRDITKPPENENIVTYRFTRVAFGVKSSPFLLGATVIHHLRQDGSATAKKIEESLYVDNIISGTDTVEEALQFYTESKKVFKNACMNVREFCSNHSGFDERIEACDRTKYKECKVLGVSWDRQNDVLSVKSPAMDNQTVTKKLVLGSIHRVYDPVGLLCPVLLPSKILLQTLNKKKIHWDEKLPAEYEKKWIAIQSDMKSCAEVKVQRYIGFNLDQCDRLMCFCDASADAYAAAVYMQRTEGGRKESHLVFAKARVSPAKKMTIPRLELLAVLLGVRMVEFMRQNLPYGGKAVIWSDSQCVLRWISDHSVTGQFVQNRLKEIRKSRKTQFRYVPTKENPADIASRGAKPQELDELWWHGPEWSTKNENEWPQWEGNIQELEAQSVFQEPEESCNAATDPPQSLPPFGLLIDKYSSFKKLVRVTAYCQRYIDKLRKLNKSEKLALEPEETRAAVLRWIKHVQETEFHLLKADILKGKKNTTQMQLGVKEHEDGILRCHGRLSQMNAADDTIYPMLLPAKSRLTSLIIEDCHKRSFHAGVAQTLATVRLEFWIPRGRTRVKSVIEKCVSCKYYSGKPFARPMMPELPTARTNAQRPFSDIGLDYFGPLYVKNGDETPKRWVCIMTCLTTRAIHLEMVKDLSAEEFLMCVRRFAARRGKPHSILSDNATQFKAVQKTDPISQTLSGEGIKWKFIPELAPWAGGIYGRLIKSVKTAMKKSLRKVLLNDSQLTTVLTEVENAVNSRPLVYVTDDINSRQVLTPNDFLGIEVQRTISSETEHLHDQDYRDKPETTREKLETAYKKQMSRLEDIWNLWQSQYLLSLRETLKYWHNDPRSKTEREPLVGEAVIIKDAKMNRGCWKIAKVEDLIRSSDGKVRSVKLFTNGHQLTRPVNLLFPLESGIPDTMIDRKSLPSDGKKETEERTSKKQRPKRKTALDADRRISKIFEDYSDSDTT